MVGVVWLQRGEPVEHVKRLWAHAGSDQGAR
jgi:hypothetical protein